jgi:hypothetical protein
LHSKSLSEVLEQALMRRLWGFRGMPISIPN